MFVRMRVGDPELVVGSLLPPTSPYVPVSLCPCVPCVSHCLVFVTAFNSIINVSLSTDIPHRFALLIMDVIVLQIDI